MRRNRAERKKVMLTGGQRARLERLWFVYGNHGGGLSSVGKAGRLWHPKYFSRRGE